MSYQIESSLGKDPVIKDLSKFSIPSGPPKGYRPLRDGEKNSDIGQAASAILHSSSLGDLVPFTIEGEQYLGRSEPHYHPPPPAGTDPAEYSHYPKPWGWHRGITVFKANEPNQNINYQPDKPTPGRLQMLQRIDGILNKLES